jgi:hypothetical protein
MATELRLITFREAELIRAVTGYHRRRGLPIPNGAVESARVTEFGNVAAVLTIRDDAGDVTELNVSDEELAAALLLYCFDRKIPLPAESEKRLYRVGGEIGLVISIRDR